MPIGSRILALCLWAVLIAAGSLLASPPAVAQSCSLSITPLAFGDVDVTANAQVNGTATATVSCTGSALLPVGEDLE